MNIKKMELFKGKRLLGIDYGTKRIGLATFAPLNDPFPLLLTTLFTPIENSLPTVAEEIKQVIKEESIDEIIIGIPHYTDGTDSEMTIKVNQIVDELEKLIMLPIHRQDETLTSFEAEDRMKNSPKYNFKIDKKLVDQLAAAIIIEDFFK